MKFFLFVIICIIAISCDEKKSQKVESSVDTALNEGYVFIDEGYVIHWDKNCKRAIKDVLLVKPISSICNKRIEYCSCVPVKMLEALKKEILMTYYFTDKTKEKILYTDESGKDGTISVANIMKYGLKKYIDSYPNYTVRMQDEFKSDYEVPFKDVFRALEIDLKIYTFKIDK